MPHYTAYAQRHDGDPVVVGTVDAADAGEATDLCKGLAMAHGIMSGPGIAIGVILAGLPIPTHERRAWAIVKIGHMRAEERAQYAWAQAVAVVRNTGGVDD